MAWIRPKTITGPPAEGERYLRREYINSGFWHHIKSGAHIVFSAPRRVGKTSIMKDLAKNPPEGILAFYDIIESDKTQKDLFKRLFNLLLERTKTHERLFERIRQYLKEIKIGGASVTGEADSITGGINFDKVELDYKNELLRLIEHLGKEKVRIVFLLDEFPEVIRSIELSEGQQTAIDTLHTLREIRQHEKFKNFTFVFAGSIGIHHVVASLERPALINDLHPIHVEQLTNDEAHELLAQLLDGATMQIGDDKKAYFLRKIDHRLPYYIQLMVEKCDEILNKAGRDVLTNHDIDAAFEMIIKEGRNFDDWESRLKRYVQREDAKYCIGILTRCAHSEPYSIQEAYNYSKKDVPAAPYKQLLDNVLIKDGYLVEENRSYRFLSPFLKEWWKHRHPKFEIEDL
ncbi:hypothetical protein Ctha_0438 [Chloroherpeton thalassium ATCC 35110]|uniref:Uncharacterized protein n=1 Tax=Chloroherpeton thalassium (strain ATCC 35110 / GB-78) TaxID=517418 RepID=B3QUK3_CHLT3|nr:AAA family ATPase [Chloroherpeton thalassium]ACF12909.1 hypothetical protein Ctha_0438 [Chloroherpeton thalassium ATCC 35110]